MTETTFTCRTCGEVHEGLPTDFGFRLPDEVHALAYIERYQRSRSNADLCALDESRYFIRGVILLPLNELDDSFGWGIWMEVDQATHDNYLAGFNDDLLVGIKASGTLANKIPAYAETQGLALEIQFQDGSSRPKFVFAANASHQLAEEQRDGISNQRHHDILEAVGHFAKQRGS